MPYASTSAEERDRLILEHIPQVRWIAASIHERLPANISQEDLVSTGILGLIAAVDNYDPAHNASLRTYAQYKIRGAILDSIRGSDGVPIHKRKRIKQVQAAIAASEQRLQRAPEEQEIAAELGVSLSEYQEWLIELRGVTLGSLDSVASEEGGASLLSYIASDEEESPARLLERSELERVLAAGIEALPRIERVVINLYFTEELTLQEIGRVVNLHTSRISQLKLQATLRLRAYMKKHWPDRARTIKGMQAAVR